MKNKAEIERAFTLLKAVKHLDLLGETVFYDDADCDGSCLLDDIRDLLDGGCI